MYVNFRVVHSDETLSEWAAWFRSVWPSYRQWYLREGMLARPSYLQCLQAIKHYMPAYFPLWEKLIAAVDGGDVEARFLSLYCPPAYQFGCSQAVWRGPNPILVRNYDYDAQLIDAVVLRSDWQRRQVLGSSDCLIGLVDGMNDAGLCLSLTFGGRPVVGEGFAMPMILRYVLQTCDSVSAAITSLRKLPTHMAYNVTLLDTSDQLATVHLAPDRKPVISNTPVATNHQPGDKLASHRWQTATVERERYLLQQMTAHPETEREFIDHFLRPPLYSFAFSRGRGTLFTAAYQPRSRRLDYIWPHYQWRLALDQPQPRAIRVLYPSV